MRIDADGIGHRLGGAAVLAGVGFRAAPGELVGLIGPNGAGKSTLLRILAGLLAPDAGTVRYDGRAASDIGRADLARRLAYLAQATPVHWPLTVAALVALGRLPHARPFGAADAAARTADRAAVERALAATGLLHLRDRAVDTLSGGERVRALLARALAVEAAVLLADEPVAALDPFHQLAVLDLLRATARAGAAVVAVLHDLGHAARWCDRVVLLHRGRVAAEGPPAAVLTPDILAACYGVRVHVGELAGRPVVVPIERM